MASIHKIKRAKGNVHKASFYYQKDGERLRYQTTIPKSDPKIAQRIADDLEATFKSAGMNSQETLTREWWKNQNDGMMRAWGLNPVFSSEVLFSGSALKWLESSSATGSTLKTYERHVKFITGHKLGPKPILAATRMDCETLLRDFAVGRAKGTVKVFRATLQAIFKYCLENELIQKNVSTGISLSFLQDGGFKRQLFSVDDVKKMREFLANPFNAHSLEGSMSLEEFGEWRIMMEMSLRGAVRIKDNSLLTSDDLALRGDVLFLKYRAEKTGAVVEIPCSDLFRQLVEDKKGFLCPTLAPKKTEGRNGLSARWLLVQEMAGVDRAAVETASNRMVSTKSFHSFRHTCPSWMAAAGIPENDVRAVTGHSGEILNEVYLHQVREEQARQKVVMDNWEKSHGL